MQRRAIRLNQDLQKGHILKKENLSFLRPAPIDSIAPYEFENVLSKELKNEKKNGDYLKHEDLK